MTIKKFLPNIYISQLHREGHRNRLFISCDPPASINRFVILLKRRETKFAMHYPHSTVDKQRWMDWFCFWQNSIEPQFTCRHFTISCFQQASRLRRWRFRHSSYNCTCVYIFPPFDTFGTSNTAYRLVRSSRKEFLRNIPQCAKFVSSPFDLARY